MRGSGQNAEATALLLAWAAWRAADAPIPSPLGHDSTIAGIPRSHPPIGVEMSDEASRAAQALEFVASMDGAAAAALRAWYTAVEGHYRLMGEVAARRLDVQRRLHQLGPEPAMPQAPMPPADESSPSEMVRYVGRLDRYQAQRADAMARRRQWAQERAALDREGSMRQPQHPRQADVAAAAGMTAQRFGEALRVGHAMVLAWLAGRIAA